MALSKIMLCCILLFSGPGAKVNEQLPHTFRGKVTGIKDGDTIEVLYRNSTVIIRLAHIDCPEVKSRQPFAQAAKKFTSAKCFGQTVTVQTVGKPDRYKRIIAVVINQRNENINRSLIEAGLAWHFTQYSSDTAYSRLQAIALHNKAGLWADPNPVAPWEWRKPKKALVP